MVVGSADAAQHDSSHTHTGKACGQNEKLRFYGIKTRGVIVGLILVRAPFAWEDSGPVREGRSGAGGAGRSEELRAMVRMSTFVGLLAGAGVCMKGVDSLIIWLAERRVADIGNENFEREAARLKRQLLQELKEKQST